MRYSSTLFNLSLRWKWLVNGTPRPLYRRKRSCTHCTGGWVWTGKENPSPNGIRFPRLASRLTTAKHTKSVKNRQCLHHISLPAKVVKISFLPSRTNAWRLRRPQVV